MDHSKGTGPCDYNSPGGPVAGNATNNRREDTSVESILTPDLYDWLKLTGWDDVEHRASVLAEYRLNQRTDEAIVRHTHNPTLVGSSVGPYAAEPQERRGGRFAYRPARPRSMSPQGPRVADDVGYRLRGYSQRYERAHYLPYGPERSPLSFNSRSINAPSRLLPSRRPPPPPSPQRPMPAQLSYRDNHHRDHSEDARDIKREMALLRAPKKLSPDELSKVRFFVMRSYSWSNVYDAMENGLWATHQDRASVLSKTLSSGVTLVLFFAVNYSHGFQGYAIMKSHPDANCDRPKWWHNVKPPVSEPFKIEWLNTTHVDSSHVAHILNTHNGNKPVFRSRNGQEIEESAGRKLIEVLETQAEKMFQRFHETKSLS
ncbi:hypothetical protein M426DRAFT_256471 [Hypoxylon sp. CI-4A]|nr:hypothetical protein M426DRAFT_256471 [Hypoxylon sp. CI-4A]